MADYSLVGFPNAGKSSLLQALSNVPVKIASYPFTTVQPKIAHCKYPDGRLFSLADLPGRYMKRFIRIVFAVCFAVIRFYRLVMRLVNTSFFLPHLTLRCP